MSKYTIDLVLPGLLNLPVHEINAEELVRSTPALHKLLRYANRAPNSLTDFDDILVQRLTLQQSALPYAHAINPLNEGFKLLFKPVHLKADINNAIVFPLDIDEDQLNHIINDLKDYFKVECDIDELPNNSWLMTLHHCQPVTEVPHYLSALGKKVTHYMQQTKANLEWFKLFNEMQMFLYQHDINQQRQQSGQAPINSLWCWGADAYQGEKLTDTLWFSDDNDVRKIGELYAGHSAPLSDLKQTDINSDTVIIELSLLKALKGVPPSDLTQVLMDIETNCLQPVMKARARQIVLHTAGPANFHYKPSMVFKFWNRAAYLPELMG